MNNNAVDYLNILLKIDTVKSHKTLSNQSKQIIYKEIRDQLPPEMLSTASLGTRKIILDILEDNIDEKSTTKSTSQKEKTSNKSTEEQLLRNADVNTRGKGIKKGMVNKTKKKRR